MTRPNILLTLSFKEQTYFKFLAHQETFCFFMALDQKSLVTTGFKYPKVKIDKINF